MHRKPTTKSHIAEEEEQKCKAKKNRSQKMELQPKTMKRLRSTSWCCRRSFWSRGPRVSQSHLGSVRRCFLNPLFSFPTWRSGLALSLMPHKKSKRKKKWRVWDDQRPKSRAWIRILKLETQITELHTEMNRSGLSLMVTTCGCSWWWRLAWWWRLVEKQRSVRRESSG